MAEIFDLGLQQHKIKMDGKFFESNVIAVAGDTARRLEVQLLDSNNMIQDTTGLTLRLNANVAGNATYTEATLINAAEGIYQVDLSNGMLLAPGTWQFQWQVLDRNGNKLNSFAFTGTVGSNISEGGTQATNFYVNADELKQMQEDLVNGTFDSAVLQTSITEKLTNLENEYAPRLNDVTAQLAQTNLKVVNIVNAKEFGAGSDKTNEENKTIIQTLINESVNEKAGRKIIVPKECEYGYDFEKPNTYLDFTGEFTDCVVEDYTEGDAVNASGMKKYGGQVRTWMCSPGLIEQNGEFTGIGNTSANSTVVRGLWNPAVVLQVDGVDIDNRRVKIFYGALGINYWSVGQGNMSIPFDASDPEEINGNNEKRRRHFNIAGKTNDINAYQNKFVIRQDTGDIGYNIAEPLFDFHLVSNPNKDGTLLEVLENRTAGNGVQSRLKTATQEIRIRLEDVGSNAGNFLLQDGLGNTFFKVTKDGTLEVTNGVACGKMTTEERNALPNKYEGLMVFDSDLNKPVWFNGAVFKDATGLTV
ncbi:hypothetical protein B795N_00330 [Marinilactibacillus psychrotolerans]|uniref:hypothetical protein n=1 Tax=Marinilactibacillus psychrotolerans TaxID=191770 RepID=UPI001C7CDB1C|nr:hypothetical protein [Marinilactibacillus psychrotolerans]GEQ32151.1 hypothetical protein B795N_00330 [Marinilactibacillus psychrotolerans]